MVFLISEMLRPVDYAAYSLQRAVIAFVLLDRNFGGSSRKQSPILSVPELNHDVAAVASKVLPQILDQFRRQHIVVDVAVVFRQQHKNVQRAIGKSEMPRALRSWPRRLDANLASLASDENLWAVFPQRVVF